MLTINKNDGQEDERELIPNIDIDLVPGGGIRLAPIIRQLMDVGFNVRESQISFKKLDENAF
jgi:hypothetical protein